MNVAPGVPRGLKQGPGLAGSPAGQPTLGRLGLGLHRLPSFARIDRGLRLAAGPHPAGPQP